MNVIHSTARPVLRATTAPPPLQIVVTGVASDSHTWNLVYLQLLLEELGHPVANLGPCVTPELLRTECLARRPDLVVVSSVNGHGHLDGPASVRALRERPELDGTAVVIGGLLGIGGPGGVDLESEMLEAGYDGVYESGAGIAAFLRFVETLAARGAVR